MGVTIQRPPISPKSFALVITPKKTANAPRFRDPTCGEIRVDVKLSLRLFRGFSLNLNASFERINDQVNLVRGNVSTEDLLLRRRELETDYRADVRIGLGYTFGSLYNNVVNTRL